MVHPAPFFGVRRRFERLHGAFDFTHHAGANVEAHRLIEAERGTVRGEAEIRAGFDDHRADRWGLGECVRR